MKGLLKRGRHHTYLQVAIIFRTIPLTRPEFRSYLYLTFTTMCWGGNVLFGKLAVGHVSPMALVTLRWLGASLLIALFFRGEVIRNWRKMAPSLPLLLPMGALGYSVFNAMFYVSAHYTTGLNIGIIQGGMPTFVLIGLYLAYRTPVGPVQMAGVAIALVGVVTVISRGDLGLLAGLAFNFGDVLMLTACCFYAGYTTGLKRLPAVPVMALFGVMAAAALAAALPMLLAEQALGQLQWPTPRGWMVVALVTLFPSFLAQIFFMKGVEGIGPGRAGVFVNLVPIFAAFLVIVFLGERMQTYHFLALALVLFGIWLSERGKAPAPETL